MNNALLNRDSATGVWKKPADGWYHIAPLGEHPHNESGLTQVLDRVAAESIVANFRAESASPNYPGLLIDYDHFSYNSDKPSEAAGWLTEMENREDGIWGKIKWTPEAEQALANGTYRLISPVWMRRDTQDMGQGRIRPLRIDSAGMTNSPQLKGMLPLSNRVRDLPAPQKPQQKESNMKSIAMALGLAAEASEDSVLSQVTQLKNRLATAETALTEQTRLATEATAETATLKNRVTELETAVAGLKPAETAVPELKNRIAILETANNELTGLVVEADLNRFSPRFKPEARDTWKAQLIANRKPTLALLESLTDAPEAKGANGQAILNRAGGAVPPGEKDFPAIAKEYIEAHKDMPKSQAIQNVIMANREKHEAWVKAGGGNL